MEKDEDKNKGKLVNCKECPYTTKEKQNLIDHINENHYDEERSKKSGCLGRCVWTYNNKDSLICTKCKLPQKLDKIPQENPKTEKVLTNKCNQCNKNFDMKRGLLIHMKKIHQQKCQQCDYTTEEKKDLESHMEKNHKKEDCKKCGRKFTNKFALEGHMKKDHPNKAASTKHNKNQLQYKKFISEMPAVLQSKRGTDEQLLRVPGDEQCMFHCLAARIFRDNSYANQLPMNVNHYMADNLKKKSIAQC